MNNKYVISGSLIGLILTIILTIGNFSYRYGSLNKEVLILREDVQNKVSIDVYNTEINNLKDQFSKLYISNNEQHKIINDKLDRLINDKLIAGK